MIGTNRNINEERDLTRWNMRRKDVEAFYYEHCYISKTPVHYHIDFYEIYLFLEGDVTYHVHSENYKLSYGDMLLISPGTIHWPEIHSAQDNYKRMFLWINPVYLEKISSGKTNLADCFSESQTKISLSGPEVLRHKELLISLSRLDDDSYGHDLLRKAYLTEIMVNINLAGKKTIGLKSENTRLKSIVNYIDENISDRTLCLEGIADEFFLSKSTLSRTFSKGMGINLHQYITKRRLNLAREKLLEGITPSKVIELIGYGDYSAFYRAFVKEFGVIPSKIRDI
ncbi:MAG TPA: AraC family transcriptional regulator [Christensenellaceae bacterium]|nr:AraC family transcriptional regulator [Christensenellaceae bacterium]